MGVMSALIRPTEIYADVRRAGVQTLTILDTGCERSVIGRQLIPDVPLTDTALKLHAVNGSAIPLIGAAVISFEMNGCQASANVVVTDALDEFILGIDLLSTNCCRWEFGAAKLYLNGCEIPVYKVNGQREQQYGVLTSRKIGLYSQVVRIISRLGWFVMVCESLLPTG